MRHRQRFLMIRRLLRLSFAATALVTSMGLSAGPALAAPTRTVQFRLPYVGGQGWLVTQGWDTCGTGGSHCGDLNKHGYDFKPPKTRLPIVAAAAGDVVHVLKNSAGCSLWPNGNTTENRVLVKHADGTYSTYAHMTDVFVSQTSPAQKVKQGQIIGTSGCTGQTLSSSGGTFEHLHFARVWLPNPSNFNSWVTMQTSFVDAASGTLSAPVELAEQYYNADNPCSNDPSKPVGDLMAVPSGAFCARYYRDKQLDFITSTPEKRYWSGLSRIDPWIDFNWGTSSFPEITGNPQTDYSKYRTYLTTSNFGARWIGRWGMPVGTYRFTVTSSGGIRLFVDDMAVGHARIDSWVGRANPVTLSEYVTFGSGTSHLIKVEYFNDGGPALVEVDWTSCAHGGC